MLDRIKAKILQDYDVLLNKSFMVIMSVRFIIVTCFTIRMLTMGWLVYDKTGNVYDLALITLFETIPFLLCSNFGGYLSDKYSQKRLMIMFLPTAIFLKSIMAYLVFLPMTDNILRLIFALQFVIGITRGFLTASTLQTLMLLVVPRESIHKATLWDGIIFKSAQIIGPVLGGLLYHYYGVLSVFYMIIGLYVVAFGLARYMPEVSVPDPELGKSSWQKMTSGFSLIFSLPTLKAIVLLDFTATIFSGVTGILPVFVKDVLHMGPDDLGYLRAAINIGAFGAGLYLAHYSLKGRVGRQFIGALILYSLSILFFAFSRNFYLSFVLLLSSGFFEWYSTMVRTSSARLLTPNHLHGRVNVARNTFSLAANNLSTIESSVVTGFAGPVGGVIIGVAVTLSAVSYTWLKYKDIKSLDMGELLARKP